MKKYQLWLQRKSYSQHLSNLIKIKHQKPTNQINERQSLTKMTHRQTSNKLKDKQNRFQSQALKLGDISYAISYRQLKNGKMRFMKAFELVHQNASMAKRIKEAKSVVMMQKQKSDTLYSKRRHCQKQYQHQNQEIRQKSFQKFIQLQTIKTTLKRHRFELKVDISHLNLKNKGHKEEGQLWCQILIDSHIVRSDMLSIKDIRDSFFQFQLQKILPASFKFKIWFCVGLNSNQICGLQVSTPKMGQIFCFDEKGQNEVRGSLVYDKVRIGNMFRSIM